MRIVIQFSLIFRNVELLLYLHSFPQDASCNFSINGKLERNKNKR